MLDRWWKKAIILVISFLLMVLITILIRSSVSGIKRPGTLPIPVYPQVQRISSGKESVEGVEIFKGSWKSEDSVSKVSIWYMNTLKDSGWEFSLVPNNVMVEDSQYFEAKKDGLSLRISIVRSEKNKDSEITAEYSPYN